MKNRRSAKIRRGRSPGFMYASARSRFAAMRMEFLLFDLGEWLDAGVNNYAKAQEESWQCFSRRRGGSLTRRGKKFSACSSLGEGEGSSLGEKVDREMDGKKEERFREESCGRGTLVEDVLPFRVVEIYLESWVWGGCLL